MPERDPIRLAVLGKLIEECCELSTRAARCIIHGLNEIDPDKALPNQELLALEAADVVATLETLHVLMIYWPADRTTSKAEGLYRWHNLIRDELTRQGKA